MRKLPSRFHINRTINLIHTDTDCVRLDDDDHGGDVGATKTCLIPQLSSLVKWSHLISSGVWEVGGKLGKRRQPVAVGDKCVAQQFLTTCTPKGELRKTENDVLI